MLIRKLHTINQQKSITIHTFTIDPHSNFIIIHNKSSSSIQLIKSTSIIKSLLKQLQYFSNRLEYSYHENIQVDDEIKANEGFKEDNDLLIEISKMYNNRQFVAVSDHFRIKLYQIKYGKKKNNKMKINKHINNTNFNNNHNKNSQKNNSHNASSNYYYFLPLNQVILQLNMPILHLTFIYSALYISYYNRQFRILQYSQYQNRWKQQNDLIKMEQQFIRITVIHSNKQIDQVIGKMKQKVKQINENIKEYCNDQGEQQHKQYQQSSKSSKSSQHSHDTRYQTIHITQKQLSQFYHNNKHKIQKKIRQLKQLHKLQQRLKFNPQSYMYKQLSQAEYPFIIYQRNDNTLYISYLEGQKDEQSYKQQSLQQQQSLQSLQSLNSQSLQQYPTNKLFKSFILCQSYQRPLQFSSLQQQKHFLDLNQQFPTRYFLTQCQKYIICLQNKGKYSIRSAKQSYQKVMIMQYWPQVNPFYYKVEEKVMYYVYKQLIKQYKQQYQQIYTRLMKYINQNYQLFVTAHISNDNSTQLLFYLHIIYLKHKSKHHPIQQQQQQFHINLRSSFHNNKKRSSNLLISQPSKYKSQKYPISKIIKFKSKIIKFKWLDSNILLVQGQNNGLYCSMEIGQDSFKIILQIYMWLIKKDKIIDKIKNQIKIKKKMGRPKKYLNKTNIKKQINTKQQQQQSNEQQQQQTQYTCYINRKISNITKSKSKNKPKISELKFKQQKKINNKTKQSKQKQKKKQPIQEVKNRKRNKIKNYL